MNLQLISKYLVERRKTLSVSQRELARMSGISLHTLSNIESGSGNPTFGSLLSICETLGLEMTVGVKAL